MKRAVYDRQFKMNAVKLAGTSASSVNEVATELGISAGTLRRWINEYDEYGESAFPGHGNALFNSAYEIKKLQKENEETENGERTTKKTPGLLEAKQCVRYQFLKEHQKQYNIQKACKILNISRSGFYDYLHRRKSKRIIENEALTEIIEDIFHEHQGRYGSRRIQCVLEQKNIHVNVKRVSQLMSERGLIAKGAKKHYRYYPNKTQYEERENILGQVFAANEKNRVWVGDITYIPTRHGFLYLAVFIDVFSRKVTGWAMDTRIKDSLAMSALYQAIGREHPPEGLIVHTDRGSQYTSQRFGAILLRYGLPPKHEQKRKSQRQCYFGIILPHAKKRTRPGCHL